MRVAIGGSKTTGHAATSSSSSSRRCVQAVCTAASSVVQPRARQQQRAMLRHLSACNLSQLSSFQGAKMLLPECLAPTGRNMQLIGSSTGARRKVVSMSFLGVGAPEAILVAVVALVVFGPKGLAEAAKSLGATLRAFQPTIREVVSVSQDIKGTLEKELGIDEIRAAAAAPPPPRRMQQTSSPVDAPSASSSAEDIDPDIEAKRGMSAQMAWGGTPPAQAQQQQAAATADKDLSTLSMEDLEAELLRRRAATSTSTRSNTGSGQDAQPPAA